MAIEIERKFLLTNESWKHNTSSEIYRQGYLCSGKGPTIRIRIAGKRSYLTVKAKHSGISRLEYEYDIPMEDATVLLAEACRQPLVEKRRYIKTVGNFIWEIDEFFGENEGLILAEIELSDEQQQFPKPDWLGKEVTDLSRYYNVNLSMYPYKEWNDNEKYP